MFVKILDFEKKYYIKNKIIREIYLIFKKIKYDIITINADIVFRKIKI